MVRQILAGCGTQKFAIDRDFIPSTGSTPNTKHRRYVETAANNHLTDFLPETQLSQIIHDGGTRLRQDKPKTLTSASGAQAAPTRTSTLLALVASG
jgi:hypothetical protein